MAAASHEAAAYGNAVGGGLRSPRPFLLYGGLEPAWKRSALFEFDSITSGDATVDVPYGCFTYPTSVGKRMVEFPFKLTSATFNIRVI